MMLFILLFLPLLGGVAALLAGRAHPKAPQWVALGCVLAQLITALQLWTHAGVSPLVDGAPAWFSLARYHWADAAGISFSLGADGLSGSLVCLASIVALLAVLAGWNDPKQSGGVYLFLLLASLSGICGAFLAADAFLFFVCYEVMLIPMFFLLVLGKGEDGAAAALRFVVFTQGSGLLLLLAALGLVLFNTNPDGNGSFEYADMLKAELPLPVAVAVLLGFLGAFAVKLPLFPLHRWQPEVYRVAPVSAALLIAGLMSKVGAYGFLRFGVSLLPEAAAVVAPWVMALGVATILYGGLLAFSQTNLRKLIAFSSMSHLGFVAVGALAQNDLAYQGVLMTMIGHALSVSGLFLLAGMLERRTGSSDIDRLGGLWAASPKSSFAVLLFALATLGLPGLANFVGEFLLLLGAFQVSPWLAGAASLGMVLSAVYVLRLVRQVLYGPLQPPGAAPCFSVREGFLAGALIALLFVFGLFPNLVLRNVHPYWAQHAIALTQGEVSR